MVAILFAAPVTVSEELARVPRPLVPLPTRSVVPVAIEIDPLPRPPVSVPPGAPDGSRQITSPEPALIVTAAVLAGAPAPLKSFPANIVKVPGPLLLR